MRWWMIAVVALALVAGLTTWAAHWLGKVLASIDEMAEDWYA